MTMTASNSNLCMIVDGIFPGLGVSAYLVFLVFIRNQFVGVLLVLLQKVIQHFNATIRKNVCSIAV